MFLQKLKKIRAPRIVLIGSFGAGNLGDELILAGFRAELGRKIPQAQVTALRGVSKFKIQNSKLVNQSAPLLPIGLRSFLSFNWFKTLQAMRQSDVVIFPGGGLFTDEESLRAILLWALHICIAKWHWKEVYLFGQSVGPFRTAIGKKIAQLALSLATTIVVRDTASLLELKKLGITATLGLDSALLLGTPRRKKPSLKKPKKILITVRDYPRLPADFFGRLATHLQGYAQAGATLTFTPFTPEDTITIKSLQTLLLRRKVKSSVIQPPPEPQKIITTISQYDLVIGMRLHSLIAAHLAGTPSIGISYSRKVSEFQKSVGQKVSELL